MTDYRDEHEAYSVTPPPEVTAFALRLAQHVAEWREKCALALESSRLSEQEVRRLRERCDMEASHIAELKEQVRTIALERDAAREKVARIMAGLEGCCMTCEPVGVRNQQMERDIETLKHQNAEFVRNLTMAQDERNAAVAERDEARREVCRIQEQVPIKEMDKATTLAEDYAEERGWDCFKEDGK